jgi:uncharacterized damage-inducible protein DinB
MGPNVGAAYLKEVLRVLHQYKALADRAVGQVSQEAVFQAPDPESNSIAIIMKHVAGNMRSRWTDFLTSDGEKPDRNRDTEFETEAGVTLADLQRSWEDGWHRTLTTIESLRPEDLLREVRIRGEALTALEAISRQVAHYAYHVGQIVLLAKHARGPAWESLSDPRRRGASA